MAKSASPIRLQANLMQEAKITAQRMHRSTAEQIEYWAELGQKVSSYLDPDKLLAVSTGLSKITLEPVYGSPVDPDEVFLSLEKDRQEGKLSNMVINSAVKYQVSEEHPGYLVQIDHDNKWLIGQFKNGEFIARKKDR